MEAEHGAHPSIAALVLADSTGAVSAVSAAVLVQIGMAIVVSPVLLDKYGIQLKVHANVHQASNGMAQPVSQLVEQE